MTSKLIHSKTYWTRYWIDGFERGAVGIKANVTAR